MGERGGSWEAGAVRARLLERAQPLTPTRPPLTPPPLTPPPPHPSQVDTSKVGTKPGPTGRCCILSCHGQRTMRTCLEGCPRLAPEEVTAADFKGLQWAFLSACERASEQGAGGLLGGCERWGGVARLVAQPTPTHPPTR